VALRGLVERLRGEGNNFNFCLPILRVGTADNVIA
jgi:hippurate hydrolase